MSLYKRVSGLDLGKYKVNREKDKRIQRKRNRALIKKKKKEERRHI
jgi:hypothetical protein